jgi:tetrahydromethanopterin S-methyltransferase subunit G
MKTVIVLSVAVVLVAPLGACSGGDRSKQVEEAAITEAEAARAGREAQIDQTKKMQLEGIEAQKSSADGLLEAPERGAKAMSTQVDVRQKFQADAQARLEKVRASLTEVHSKLEIGRGRAPTALQDQVGRGDRLTSELSSQIDRLPEVSYEGWSAERARIEERLDELEKSVDDAQSKADDIVK